MERDAPGSVILVCTPHHICTIIKHIHSYKFTTSRAAQPCLQQAFLKCEGPAESVDKSKSIKWESGSLSLYRTVLAAQQNAWVDENRERKKRKKICQGRKTENCLPQGRHTWCEGQPNHSPPPSPPLQITRDTRVKEGRSNEGHISCYTEALPIQHYRNTAS